MLPIRNLTILGFVLVVLVALSGQAFASSSNTVAVGNCTKFPAYATIQLAVNAVPAGGTVKVCPGSYPEQVMINKSLTLIGNGPTASTVVAPGGGLSVNGKDIFGNFIAAQIFVEDAASVTISHMAVDGANGNVMSCGIDPMGIYFQNSSGVITDNAVRNVLYPTGFQGCQGGLAINVEANVGSPAVTVSNNSVRNYDKNGITASGPGVLSGAPKVTVTGNTVVGEGAITVTAQNGIQIGYSAQGTVQNNYVVDDIYVNPPNCSPSGVPQYCYAASGILIYDSEFIAVAGNIVESTQFGIVPDSDSNGDANHTVIQKNTVIGTQSLYGGAPGLYYGDAIDLCSNNNQAIGNIIYGSSMDAIHLDDSCGPATTGSGNYVESNTINEACAGILIGPLSSGNTIPLSGTGVNTFLNVDNTILANSDVCTPTLGPTGRSRAKHLRPSPYKPNRN